MAENIEDKRFEQMVETLQELTDGELMSMFREANSRNYHYEFVDGWDMDEFLTMMVDGKDGRELKDFIMEVAEAVNDYSGTDGVEDAVWGYFDGYTLEIKDESDIIEEAREDYLENLAQDIIDGDVHDLPSEVEDLQSEWDYEDERGWLGAGDYVAYDEDGNEVETQHFNDAESYLEWTDSNELWSFDCVETDA